MPAILRAIRGDTAQELWNVTDPALRLHWGAQIAAADLDGDNQVEIIVPLGYGASKPNNQTPERFRTGRLLCFEHTEG